MSKPEAVVTVSAGMLMFLRAGRRAERITVPCDGVSTVGHLVESLGVPRTEVGGLTVNGHPVEQRYLPHGGDVIEVHPVARPQQLGSARFVLDVHLGALARRLRLIGLDTAYANDAADDDLVSQANAERRVLLTQDRALLCRGRLWAGAYVRGARPDDQLRDVLDRFAPPLAPWTRCTACNGQLRPVAKSAIEQLLEPRFKGRLCVPFPVNLTGLLMLTLAMQRGGNERNIEPGWGFLRELAEKGQIGRVINNNSEFINAMSSGETSVAFFNIGAWTTVRKQFPVRLLTRMKDNKGFLFNEGFAVIKGEDRAKVAAGKRLANHFATAPVNEQYNWPLGSGPTNPGAKANPDVADVFYKPDELAQFGYIADFAYMATQVDGWAKRWEQEIAPIIRKA